MAQKFTIVRSEGSDPQEALYVDGRFAGAPDGGGPFSAAVLLELVASRTIAVEAGFVEVDQDFDSEHTKG